MALCNTGELMYCIIAAVIHSNAFRLNHGEVNG